MLVDRGRSPTVSDFDLGVVLEKALVDLSIRDAVDLVSKAHALPRRQVYQAALALNKG